MWLFTTIGFFSVTNVGNKKGDEGVASDYLQVRARVRGDLDLLRTMYLPELTETVELPGRDYPYRGYVDRASLGVAMVKMIQDLTYSNFKNEVIVTQGLPRELLYAKVWSVMYNAEQKLEEEERVQARKSRTPLSMRNDDLDSIFDRFSTYTEETPEPYVEDLMTAAPRKSRRPAPRPKTRKKR
jgi:hypothetical protein